MSKKGSTIVPELVQAHIAREYQGGKTLARLQHETGYSEFTIRKTLERQGVATRNTGAPRKDAERAIARAAYESGARVMDCAFQAGVSFFTVYQWAKRDGWQRHVEPLKRTPLPHKARARRTSLAVAPVGLSLHLSDSLRQHRGAESILAPRDVPSMWRCTCGALVRNDHQCINGHVAPWAEAA